MSLAAQMRQAIQDSGITLYKLSQESGVSRSQLSRFMRAERDLSLEVAEKVCAVLGIVLAQRDIPTGTPAATPAPPPADELQATAKRKRGRKGK